MAKTILFFLLRKPILKLVVEFLVWVFVEHAHYAACQGFLVATQIIIVASSRHSSLIFLQCKITIKNIVTYKLYPYKINA